jgi:hypothetical protein
MDAQVVKVSRWIKRCDDSGAEYAVSECGAANFCTDMAGCVRCAEVVGSQPRGWRFFWRGWMRNVGDGKGHVGWTIWCRINRIHDLVEKLGEFKALVVIGVAGGDACGCWVRRAVRWLDLALVDHFFQGRSSGNHHSSLLDLRIA